MATTLMLRRLGLAEGFGRLCFHCGQPRVIVGELVEVSQCDLSSGHIIVPCYIGRWVPAAMLQLYIETDAELLHIELTPVDAAGGYQPRVPNLTLHSKGCRRA